MVLLPVIPNTVKSTAASVFDSLQLGRGVHVHFQNLLAIPEIPGIFDFANNLFKSQNSRFVDNKVKQNTVFVSFYEKTYDNF